MSAISHAALTSLVSQLRLRGVRVVAWVPVAYPSGAHGIVLVCEGGRWAGVSYAQLGARLDTLADEIAARVGGNGIPVMDPPEVPEISQRTWAWWRYLRWNVVTHRASWW